MNYIVVRIKDIDYVKVLFQDEFIQGNQYYTQNTLIGVLELLFKDYSVDLYYKEIEGDK